MGAKRAVMGVTLFLALLLVSGCGSAPAQVTIERGSNTGTIQTFKETSDPLCKDAEGKPLVRMFGTSWCPHCTWVKDTYRQVVEKYAAEGKIHPYLWELDTNDDLLTKEKDEIPQSEAALFKKYNPEGSIPTFVFGCRYVRIGNGYEQQNDHGSEEAEFKAVIDELLKEAEQRKSVGQKKETAEQKREDAPKADEESAAKQGGVKEFHIVAQRFSFAPDTITVNKGDVVKLTVTSVDVDHGLYIAGYGINVKVKNGEEQTAEFIAEKPGTFTFTCSVYCGSGHSHMNGKLVVNE